jgi:hypothetical protein
VDDRDVGDGDALW